MFLSAKSSTRTVVFSSAGLGDSRGCAPRRVRPRRSTPTRSRARRGVAPWSGRRRGRLSHHRRRGAPGVRSAGGGGKPRGEHRVRLPPGRAAPGCSTYERTCSFTGASPGALHFVLHSGSGSAPRAGPEEAVEHPRRLGLGARHEVPVQIERDRDVRMTHERREHLRVHPRGDHQRRIGVPRGVEGDRHEPAGLPAVPGPLGGAPHLRQGAEHLALAGGAHAVLHEVVAQHGGYRHGPLALRGLRGDLTLDGVPASPHADDALGEVHVLPAQRDELPAAQAGVERRRSQCPIGGLHGVEERGGLVRAGDVVAA